MPSGGEHVSADRSFRRNSLSPCDARNFRAPSLSAKARNWLVTSSNSLRYARECFCVHLSVPPNILINPSPSIFIPFSPILHLPMIFVNTFPSKLSPPKFTGLRSMRATDSLVGPSAGGGGGGTVNALQLFLSVLVVLLLPITEAISDGALKLNAKCKDLFMCTVQNKCVQLESLQSSFENATIGKELYNELDKNIDYGCIFTAGCLDECNRCPLCMTSKQQLVDVLSGNRRSMDGECAVLVNCAAECVQQANHDLNKISFCLRHKCAFHCFDGSCPKCSAFVTRIFNQICIAADFRRRIQEWKGHCYEMFRAIVVAKFEEEFVRTGATPSIGNRNGGGGQNNRLLRRI